MKPAAASAIDIDEKLPPCRATAAPSWIQRSCRKAFLSQLAQIHDGNIELRDYDGTIHHLGPEKASLSVRMQVTDPQFYASVVLGGTVAAGESFARGEWHCDRLPDLIRIVVRNQHAHSRLEGAGARLISPLRRAAYYLQRNTRTGSRRNIAAHYDLGNEFFALFLDAGMMYSSAIFEPNDASLEAASACKLRKICESIDLRPEHHLLEIGTGWGGFAEFAAREFGCRVTTTTISAEQYRYAVKRIADAGLTDRVTLLMDDYRDLSGQYDRLVSIEMIEAVGADFYDEYFTVCRSRLKPGGRALIQAITIRDDLFDAARREVDFIKKYIFPGSCIPSLAALRQSAEGAGFQWRITHDLTHDYARTLSAWRERFMAHADAIRAMGFSEDFIRLWVYYFGYCEGGFAERHIGDYHIHLEG